jgi:cell division protein FtsQ
MENKKRYSIKKILFALLWLVIGTGTTVLLVAAIRKNDSKQCKKVTIKISGIENTLFNDEKFVDEKDILNTIEKVGNGNPVGKSIGSFDLRQLETELEKSTWIKNAELFFDNNDILKVTVQEREPVARVFTAGGTSFYIDTALKMLPLSDKFSARLPVFTNFPSDKIVLSAADSNLLRAVRDISIVLQKDSFSMAMIDQVDITAQQNFEMIPKIGNQLIVFGNATDIEEKFSKLQLFYKQVMIKTGWSKYSEINVQYKNQVVAKKRGAEDKTADSVRTLQIMQLIAADAARQAEDSLQTILQDNNNNTADGSMIQQSIQREDNFETTNAIQDQPLQPTNQQPVLNPANANPIPVKKPVTIQLPPAKPPVPKPDTRSNIAPVKKVAATNPIPAKKPTVVKPNPQKPTEQKPKVVMPKKNEY